ncbi:MAG: FAD-dependent oxidoreductase [Methylotetracoccus sp.]
MEKAAQQTEAEGIRGPGPGTPAIIRRRFLEPVGTTAAGPAVVSRTNLRSVARVAVIGGGFGGATAAKYLRRWSGGALQVHLISRDSSYLPPVLSNLVLNGRLPLSALRQEYSALASRYGVVVSTGGSIGSDAIDLGTDGRVRIRGYGDATGFDRLLLAPGIGFAPLPFAPETPTPLRDSVLHAWVAGAQTNALRTQLRTMRPGGTFILTIPASPFRSPSAAYERACIVADYLLAKEPRSHIIVLDANRAMRGGPETSAIAPENETFSLAFETLYASVLSYHANRTLIGIRAVRVGGRQCKQVRVALVDPETREVLREELYVADMLNAIPEQRAADLVRQVFGGALVRCSHDLEPGRWAAVDPISYESTRVRGVHVVGDSQDTNHPKSAHMANAEAKICADAIVRAVGLEPVAISRSSERASATADEPLDSIGRARLDWAFTLFSDAFG